MNVSQQIMKIRGRSITINNRDDNLPGRLEDSNLHLHSGLQINLLSNSKIMKIIFSCKKGNDFME